uniref:Uncharacterized protein n=1 Tax=Glossina pallidipes TaxID=7398 RepID=A0A1A9Z5P4_GLOPL
MIGVLENLPLMPNSKAFHGQPPIPKEILNLVLQRVLLITDEDMMEYTTAYPELEDRNAWEKRRTVKKSELGTSVAIFYTKRAYTRFDTKRFIKHDLPTPPSPKITTFNKVLLLGGRIFILTRCQPEGSTDENS